MTAPAAGGERFIAADRVPVDVRGRRDPARAARRRRREGADAHGPEPRSCARWRCSTRASARSSASSARSSSYSSEKARTTLGWTPRPIEDTIVETGPQPARLTPPHSPARPRCPLPGPDPLPEDPLPEAPLPEAAVGRLGLVAGGPGAVSAAAGRTPRPAAPSPWWRRISRGRSSSPCRSGRGPWRRSRPCRGSRLSRSRPLCPWSTERWPNAPGERRRHPTPTASRGPRHGRCRGRRPVPPWHPCPPVPSRRPPMVGPSRGPGCPPSAHRWTRPPGPMAAAANHASATQARVICLTGVTWRDLSDRYALCPARRRAPGSRPARTPGRRRATWRAPVRSGRARVRLRRCRRCRARGRRSATPEASAAKPASRRRRRRATIVAVPEIATTT